MTIHDRIRQSVILWYWKELTQLQTAFLAVKGGPTNVRAVRALARNEALKVFGESLAQEAGDGDNNQNFILEPHPD